MVLEKRSITIRKMIGLARCGRSARKTAFSITINPFSNSHFHGWSRPKGRNVQEKGEKRGEQSVEIQPQIDKVINVRVTRRPIR